MAIFIIPFYFLLIPAGCYLSFTTADHLYNQGHYVLAIGTFLLMPAGWLVAKALPGLRKNGVACIALAPVFGLFLSMAAAIFLPEIFPSDYSAFFERNLLIEP